MKAINSYLLLALLASVFIGCDLFFPYKLEDIPTAPEIQVPEGAFSVARDRYVYFSSGNLQYHAGMDKWRFAPNQYDYVGEGNSNISSSYNGWIDLYGWGTGASPTSQEGRHSFIDWGVNRIGDYEERTWRTLTADEWEYILDERKNASLLQGLARIADINVLILLPDNWKCPSGVTFNSNNADGFYQNVYSISKWHLLEDAGAICLPAAGYRNGSWLEDVSCNGFYWSSSEGEWVSTDHAALTLRFGDNFYSAYVGEEERKYHGHSVRLVR